MRKRLKLMFGVSLIVVGAAASTVAAQSELAPDQSSSVQIIDAQNPPEGFVRPQLAQPQPMTMNDYPAEAFFDAVEGLVVLRGIVREDGTIGDVEIVTLSGASVFGSEGYRAHEASALHAGNAEWSACCFLGECEFRLEDSCCGHNDNTLYDDYVVDRP